MIDALRPRPKGNFTLLLCFRPVRSGSWGTGLGLRDCAPRGSYVLLAVLPRADHWTTSCDLAAGRSRRVLHWLRKLRGNRHRRHEPQCPQPFLGRHSARRPVRKLSDTLSYRKSNMERVNSETWNPLDLHLCETLSNCRYGHWTTDKGCDEHP
jgi:hypothetical protein